MCCSPLSPPNLDVNDVGILGHWAGVIVAHLHYARDSSEDFNSHPTPTCPPGDAAYGDGGTRQAFADAGRKLVARVPGRPDRQRFPKDDFVIDLAAGSCTCPAGRLTHTIVPAGKRTDGMGRVHHLRAFQFHGSECMTCPLRSQCISAKGRKGRWVLILPQEPCCSRPGHCNKAPGMTNTERAEWWWNTGWPDWSIWASASPAIGRAKTKFQLYLAVTVANLTLVAGKLRRSGRASGDPTGHSVVLNILPSVVANVTASFSAVRLGLLWPVILLTPALLPKCLYPMRTFRPGSREDLTRLI